MDISIYWHPWKVLSLAYPYYREPYTASASLTGATPLRPIFRSTLIVYMICLYVYTRINYVFYVFNIAMPPALFVFSMTKVRRMLGYSSLGQI